MKSADEAVTVPARTSSQAARSPLDERARGSTIGRYLVLETLGTGGMGVVYAAYDPVLDRRVALKLLRDVAADDDGTAGKARMHREAQSLAKLAHPNVVAVHDVGDDAGAMFIAMELVDGASLTAWQEGKPWRAIVDVYADAARGLAAAHAAGFVHRDFKPDNVLIGADGRVRVTDFGLARAVGPDAGSTVSSGIPAGIPAATALASGRLTAAGTVMGTPRYMAPEQIDGAEVDARTDQFAWCLALWEALYHEPPFPVTNLAIRSASMKTDVPKSPAGSPVPRAVGRLLLRGLAPEPAARWPNFDEVLAELRRITASRTPLLLFGAALVGVALVVVFVVGRSAGTVERPRCDAAGAEIDAVWSTQTRELVTTTFAATGAPFAADAAASIGRGLDDWRGRYRDAARASCRATYESGTQSAGMLDLRGACLGRARDQVTALVSRLQHADRDDVAGARELPLPDLDACSDIAVLAGTAPAPTGAQADATRTAIEADLAAFAAEVTAQPAIPRARALQPIAATLVVRARAFGWQPLHARALIAQAELQMDLGEGTLARESLVTAAAASSEAADLEGLVDAYTHLVHVEGKLTSDFALGENWAAIAGGTLARLGPRVDAKLKLLTARGALASAAGDDQASKQFLVEALPLAHQRGANAELDVLERLAVEEEYLGDLKSAAGHLQTAEALARSELGSNHPKLAAILHDKGLVAYTAGDYAAAESQLRTALALRQKAVGADTIEVATTTEALGTALIALGRLDEAKVVLERAITVMQARLGSQHPDVATALNEIGGAYHQAGQYRLELETNQRALAIREAALGPDHKDVAQSLVNVAIASKALGEWGPVLPNYRRAIAIFDKVYGPTHMNTAIAELNYAEALRVRGKLDEAGVEYARATAGFAAQFPEDHPLFGHIWNGVGQLEYARGHYELAIADLEHAVALREQDPGDAPALAETRFALASAVAAHAHVRTPRARELAGQARDGYRGAGANFEAKAAEIDRWLAAK